MKRLIAGGCSLLLLSLSVLGGCSQEARQKTESPRKMPTPPAIPSPNQKTQSGEELFKQYCAPCHPDGGNVSDPARTLHGSSLSANHISRPEDIVRIMRHPISRMIRFDATTISDKDATAIAEYVLSTFK